jgi:voltage-gated potassium channel
MPVEVAAVVSLVALVKLARYVSALRLLANVMRNESRPLLSAMLTLIVLLVLASGAMYLLEHGAQPDQFSSIPHTLWWGIVTIATVGYGDMTPVTMGGKVFGGMIMLLGVAMFAVPAGILATGFAAEIRRRDFLVTWQTVAQVPLFAGLDASRIAEITRLLKPQIVPARHVIVRHGDPADSMFFIMSGEVEVELQPRPVTLKKGAYFGEIALLKETTRTATVTTLTDCHLLALDVGDFKRLMTTYPAIEENVMKLADSRLKELEPGGSGDNRAG